MGLYCTFTCWKKDGWKKIGGLGEVKKHLTNITYSVAITLLQRYCTNDIVGISEYASYTNMESQNKVEL